MPGLYQIKFHLPHTAWTCLLLERQGRQAKVSYGKAPSAWACLLLERQGRQAKDRDARQRCRMVKHLQWHLVVRTRPRSTPPVCPVADLGDIIARRCPVSVSPTYAGLWTVLPWRSFVPCPPWPWRGGGYGSALLTPRATPRDTPPPPPKYGSASNSLSTSSMSMYPPCPPNAFAVSSNSLAAMMAAAALLLL